MRRPILASLFVLALAAAVPALAQETADAEQDARAELQSIEQSISISKERADKLRQEIDDMSGDRAQQNAALIAAGQRVKIAEIEVGAAEDKLTSLRTQEADIRKRLDGKDKTIAALLEALQRVSRNPPPAVVVNPTDALSSARAAILLSAVLPTLSSDARAVAADLRSLTDVRQKAEDETTQLRAQYAALFEDQLRIATLIEARKRGVARASADLAAEEQQATDLAARADSLNQLIKTLTERIASVTEASRAAATARSASDLTPDEVKLALANTDRSEPAIAFPSARGYLTVPASGVTVTDFGANDGFGGVSEGQSIVTRADAQVVAPADGWVMYKGPYLNYGQILILNPGDDYTILLAGLDDIDVDLGQFVLMGEPVGKMGSRTIGRTVTTTAGVSRPTLYIEIRNQSGPIDPDGWWAPAQERTQSG